jgi:uncharacterized protein DUF6174
MKWQRILPLSCAGTVLACLALPFLPYFWRVGQASQAQQQWVHNGASRYTMVAINSCCPSTGRVKLTVENGLVTAADPIDLPNFALPSTPSYFDFMTIEAMLRKAGSATRKSWNVPWFSELIIKYDPTYGYITNYTENPTGWLAKFIGHVRTTPYYYTAYDLQFGEP